MNYWRIEESSRLITTFVKVSPTGKIQYNSQNEKSRTEAWKSNRRLMTIFKKKIEADRLLIFILQKEREKKGEERGTFLTFTRISSQLWHLALNCNSLVVFLRKKTGVKHPYPTLWDCVLYASIQSSEEHKKLKTN